MLCCRLHRSSFHAACNLKQTIKDPISVRSFSIKAATSSEISLIQKDRKFFRKGYDYSWARILVGMKESEGYRWVAGTYCKGKIASVQCLLDPGQYYVLAMVDWAGEKSYDMRLNYSGNS